MTDPTIAFIGPMGAGKSSIGRRVARGLGRRFADTDALIAAEHAPIPELFAAVGESGFRALEGAIVHRELAAGGVVALGGGAVLDPATRDQLGGCTVVLLTVSEEAVGARIAGGRRPLLVDGVASWRRIADDRAPVYAALADVVVDTSLLPMTAIADDLTARLAVPTLQREASTP